MVNKRWSTLLSGINGQVPLTVQLPNTGGGAVVATAQGILGLKEAITGFTALEALLLCGDNAFDLSISLDVCRSLEGGVHSYSNDIVARKVVDWVDGIGSYPGSSIPKWQQKTGLGLAQGYYAYSSPGSMQKQVEKGHAPSEVDKVHDAHVPGQKPHVHLKGGSVLNNDGTTSHQRRGTPNPSRDTVDWLKSNGWEAGK